MPRYRLITSRDRSGGWSEYTEEDDAAAIAHARRHLYDDARIVQLTEVVSFYEERRIDIPEGMRTRLSTCKHCGRAIVEEAGRWIDPEAPATPEEGDDYIWRETCDANDTFTAEHEPETT